MPYAMDSARRFSCWIIPVRWNRIGPKPEELAAARPMKGSRTRRVCALGMLLLVQRGSPYRSAVGERLPAVSLPSRCPFFFQTLNGCPQPASNRFFGLLLVAAPVDGIQRLTENVEWNVTAGNLFGTALRWYQLHQNTIAARTWILFGIVVHASERVFENILRPPRSSRRTPIASILEELKFKFENFQ